MKRIGLLGGMSWESSLEYYRLLNEMVKNRLGGLHSAECIMASVDFGPVSEMMKSNDWKGIERVLTAAANDLKRAGADFLIICTNTMHLLAREIEGASGLEVLEIGKAVGKEIERKGLKTVGLLGTRFTMERSYYRDTLAGFGINEIVPSEEEMVVVDRIIFEELCKGIFREESKSAYKRVINELQLNGAEGVILGCTEIPLLIKESDVDIPVFDTTAIHARAAVDHALA
ncbi:MULTISPECIES: aspartate/glutamate racemase family protein [unclassified Mesotoga]|uniref:aspartate/glutamate racemase family protein n=1 Tax=unclassified Mesotoga TaxID=1184398 RepID=UPI000DA6B96A|nr:MULTISPECIES: aspartate/glutamate racemase family protein [unclassified Mesotoga]PZC51827.1 aspartate racemase [Mesotoga sp. TolDC]